MSTSWGAKKAWLHYPNQWRFFGSVLAPEWLSPHPPFQYTSCVLLSVSESTSQGHNLQLLFHEQSWACLPGKQPGPLRLEHPKWPYSALLWLKVVLTIPAAGRHSSFHAYVTSHLTLTMPWCLDLPSTVLDPLRHQHLLEPGQNCQAPWTLCFWPPLFRSALKPNHLCPLASFIWSRIPFVLLLEARFQQTSGSNHPNFSCLFSQRQMEKQCFLS